MKVRDAMTWGASTCTAEQTLDRVGRIMWERNCGCVPVVDTDGDVVGMITDRDVSMAAYTQGRPLREIFVASAMSQNIYVCHEDDSIEQAEHVMRAKKVRRLPVLGADGDVVGVLSLGDLARQIVPGARRDGPVASAVAQTLGAICEPMPG
jgi:CBS domain-containing protein